MNNSENMPKSMSKSMSISYDSNIGGTVTFFELLLELGDLNYLYTELNDSILLEF